MEQEAATGYDRMLDELQREIAEREAEIYSEVVLREARNPRNVGSIADADLHGIVHGWCGDTMEIFIRLNGGTIERSTFITDGCGATLACGSMLTQMVTGMRLEQAERILPVDLIKAIGGLPEESMHCAGLAVSTLQNALFNWRVSQMEQQEAD